MDPVRNPYHPGAGSRPPFLVGRDGELASFDTAVQRLAIGKPAKSQLLTGLRGVGKTVLLREFAEIARGHGWVTEHIEATEDLDFVYAVSSVARKALLRMRARDRLRDRAHRALSVLSAFRVRWKLPGADLELSIDPLGGLADSGMLDSDLGDLFAEIAAVAQADGIGVLITIDEMQYLDRSNLGALIVALHRISQENLPLLVAGAGLPSLPGLAGEAKSYAERLFEFSPIELLTAVDAAAALRDPATEEGVAWADAAIDQVLAATHGYPYFLQEFGKQAWDVAVGPDSITAADVATAVPIAVEELDSGFFRARFDRASDSERAYIAAMASLGAGPCAVADVSVALHKTTSQLGPVRDGLVRRGLCYSPRWGQIAFTVPMFDEFVRRTTG